MNYFARIPPCLACVYELKKNSQNFFLVNLTFGGIKCALDLLQHWSSYCGFQAKLSPFVSTAPTSYFVGDTFAP